MADRVVRGVACLGPWHWGGTGKDMAIRFFLREEVYRKKRGEEWRSQEFGLLAEGKAPG